MLAYGVMGRFHRMVFKKSSGLALYDSARLHVSIVEIGILSTPTSTKLV